jgi:excisionase family DNA binding protein
VDTSGDLLEEACDEALARLGTRFPSLARLLKNEVAALHLRKIAADSVEYTPGQCAAALGLSVRTVLRLIETGRLPARRVNQRVLRVPARALEEFHQSTRAGGTRARVLKSHNFRSRVASRLVILDHVTIVKITEHGGQSA